MISLSDWLEALVDTVKNSDYAGCDLEAHVTYVEDDEGSKYLYVTGSPMVKFSVVKDERGKVKVYSYMANGVVMVDEDDDE